MLDDTEIQRGPGWMNAVSPNKSSPQSGEMNPIAKVVESLQHFEDLQHLDLFLKTIFVPARCLTRSQQKRLQHHLPICPLKSEIWDVSKIVIVGSGLDEWGASVANYFSGNKLWSANTIAERVKRGPALASALRSLVI
jgi:hypothetical protein